MSRLTQLSLVAALILFTLTCLGVAQSKAQAASAYGQSAVHLPAVFAGRSDLTASEWEALNLINQARKAAGCPAVVSDPALDVAAKRHSQDMANHNYFSHIGLDGSTYSQRASAAGYEFNASGEIIAAGYTDPRKVVDGWMGSQGHREIIQQCSHQSIGIGAVSAPGSQWGHYWTALFGYR